MNTQDHAETLFTKEFLSKISHHSRSPFNGLLGFAELLLLKQNEIKSESATEYLLRINMLAKKAFISSENIVLFLKIYSNNVVPILSNTQFSAIFNQAFNLNKESFILKKVEFVKESGTDFFINCDAFLTGTIITNVILKALKLCDDGSKLVYNSKLQKQKQLITFSYTGLPIESEIVRNFFSKNTTNQKLFAPELDIELWLCYQLAKVQNINFKVAFSENNSTTFSVEI